MSALSLRIPKSMHEQLRELASEEGISINQFVTLAIAASGRPRQTRVEVAGALNVGASACVWRRPRLAEL